MTIRLSPLPSPRRTLPALAMAVAVGFLTLSAAFPSAGIAHDAGAFTGRYEHGLPVYRLAPIEVSMARGASGVTVATSGTAQPHVDAVSAECTAPST